MCSSNKVQHRDEDRGRDEGPPEGEHAGQLKKERGARQSMLLSFPCRIDDVESSRIVVGAQDFVVDKKVVWDTPDEQAD